MNILDIVSSWFSLAAAAFCAVFVLLIYGWYRRPKNFPPGPRGLPFVGCIPFLSKPASVTYKKWSEVHGPVMSVRLGNTDWITLNDYKSLYEAFEVNKSTLSGKPKIPFIYEISGGRGLAFMDMTDYWKSQRNFGMKILRGHGIGSKSLEDRVKEEAIYLTEAIQVEKGKPFDLKLHANNAAAGCICNVVFGKRFDYNNRKFKEGVTDLSNFFNSPEYIIMARLSMFVPSLMNIPPLLWLKQKAMKKVVKVIAALTELISDAKSSFDPENIQGFIDAFLVEMNKGNDESFTELQLLHYIRLLYIAGTETVGAMILWSVVIMLNYPETQEKLHQEISQVLGSSKQCGTDNEADLPYTNAFVEEIFRYRATAPQTPPHKATADTKICGFIIPKGTRVIGNLLGAHFDAEVFEEPDKFKPERHLDENGNFVKSKYVIPFSLGPRQCLGMQLARTEVFIYLASIVQKFDFQPADKVPSLQLGTEQNFFVPHSYEVVAKHR